MQCQQPILSNCLFISEYIAKYLPYSMEHLRLPAHPVNLHQNHSSYQRSCMSVKTLLRKIIKYILYYLSYGQKFSSIAKNNQSMERVGDGGLHTENLQALEMKKMAEVVQIM